MVSNKRGNNNALRKADVNKRLETVGKHVRSEDALKKASMNLLLDVALAHDVISREEYDVSSLYEIKTLKRYVGSVVKDAGVLSALDSYVIKASQVYAAGSKVANLFAVEAFDGGLFDGAEGDAFFSASLLDQTFVKYLMMPFKAVLVNERAAAPLLDGRQCLGSLALLDAPSEVVSTWHLYGSVLYRLYPGIDELVTIKWDQILGDMARQYIGEIKTHVLTHLASRARAYVFSVLEEDRALKVRTLTVEGVKRKFGSVDGDDATFAIADLYGALETGVLDGRDLPAAVTDVVSRVRGWIGLGAGEKLEDVDTLTAGTFRAHVLISRELERRGRRAFSALPVAKTRRSFAYLDARVVDGLLPRSFRGTRNLEGIGLSRDAWNLANRRARAQARRNPRTRKQRRTNGKSIWKADWQASSACTDGVAVCVVVKRRKSGVRDPTAYVPRPRPCDLRAWQGAHVIAEDPGRANISQTAQAGADGQLIHGCLPREAFLRRSKQDRFRQAEDSRRKSRGRFPLRHALDRLSGGTWRSTDSDVLLDAARRTADVHDILVDEYVADRWYARWRMLLWRRKRSVLMQTYSDVVRAGGQTRDKVLFAVGDRCKGRCGPGERPVPTIGARKHCWMTLRSQRSKYDALMIEVNEDMTTAMCHRCHKRLEDVVDEFGLTLRDTKHCPHCVGPDGRAGVFRNRDKNAAINILEATKALLAGRDRPAHLCRATADPRKRKRPAKKKIERSNHA